MIGNKFWNKTSAEYIVSNVSIGDLIELGLFFTFSL